MPTHDDTPPPPTSLPNGGSGSRKAPRSASAAYPRRRRRRGWSPLMYFARLAAVAIAGGVIAYVSFLFLVKVIHPYKLGYEESQKRRALQAELARQNRENDALLRQVTYLRSPEGTEREARRAGFHVPGETVYLLPRDDRPSDTEPLKKSPPNR